MAPGAKPGGGPRRPRRRWRRWLGVAALLLLGAGLGGWLFLQARYNDEALAASLVRDFNRTHRGRITIERVHWGPHAVWALLRGGDTDIQIENVRIFDPGGSLVARVPEARARLDVRALLLDDHLVISRVRAQGALIRLAPVGSAEPGEAASARERGSPAAPPGPRIGLLAALASKAGLPGFIAAPSGEPSVTVVDGIHVSGIRVEARLARPRLAARLVGAALRGSVRHVSDGHRGQWLRLRLELRSGPGFVKWRKRRLALRSLELHRLELGQSPGDPDLRVAASVKAGARPAKLWLWGRVRELLSAEPARLALQVRARGFGALAARLSGQPLRERDSGLVAHLGGALAHPQGRLRLGGLGFAHPRGQATLRDLVAVATDDALWLDSLRLTAAGGTVRARAPTMRSGSTRCG